jgi:hypothetical protein
MGASPSPAGATASKIVPSDLASEVTRLRATGAKFRNEIVKGNGGLQIQFDDPSGNPIELFQPY